MNLKLLGVVLAISAAYGPVTNEQANSAQIRRRFDQTGPRPTNVALATASNQVAGQVVSHFSLRDLILVGWHILPFQVAGGPAWIYSEPYDIEAKAAGNPDGGESRLMVQSLAGRDRFHLALHYGDTRAMRFTPLYRQKRVPGPVQDS